jgi:hypothetical protein
MDLLFATADNNLDVSSASVIKDSGRIDEIWLGDMRRCCQQYYPIHYCIAETIGYVYES